jgi:hypothetical protein
MLEGWIAKAIEEHEPHAGYCQVCIESISDAELEEHPCPTVRYLRGDE